MVEVLPTWLPLPSEGRGDLSSKPPALPQWRDTSLLLSGVEVQTPCVVSVDVVSMDAARGAGALFPAGRNGSSGLSHPRRSFEMLCHSFIRVEVQSPHVAFVDVGEVFQWWVGAEQLLSGVFCLLGSSFLRPSHLESRFWLGVLFVCFFASFGISRLLALSAFEIYETQGKPKGPSPRSLVPRSLPGLLPSFLPSEPSYV